MTLAIFIASGNVPSMKDLLLLQQCGYAIFGATCLIISIFKPI